MSAVSRRRPHGHCSSVALTGIERPLVAGVRVPSPIDGETMKMQLPIHRVGRFRLFAAALLAILFLSLTAWADDIKESDYPIHYEVLSTRKMDKLLIQKVCSMTLRDQANANVIITVSRTRIGSCHVLPDDQVYNGRLNPEKNSIEIVIPVGEDRARIETWHVDATVQAAQ